MAKLKANKLNMDDSKYVYDLGRASGYNAAIAACDDHNCSHENCQCWIEIARALRVQRDELK